MPLWMDAKLGLDAETKYKVFSVPGFVPSLWIDRDLMISVAADSADEQLAAAEQFLAEVTTWVEAVREYMAELGS